MLLIGGSLGVKSIRSHSGTELGLEKQDALGLGPGWPTWVETSVFALAEVFGGVTTEASLLATRFPALVQLGTPPPIRHVTCPPLQPFLRSQSRGQARHHSHRSLHHQTRRHLLPSAGTPFVVALRTEQVLQVVVRPRDVR
jgi:hypothetical protein